MNCSCLPLFGLGPKDAVLVDPRMQSRLRTHTHTTSCIKFRNLNFICFEDQCLSQAAEAAAIRLCRHAVIRVREVRHESPWHYYGSWAPAGAGATRFLCAATMPALWVSCLIKQSHLTKCDTEMKSQVQSDIAHSGFDFDLDSWLCFLLQNFFHQHP